MKVLGAPAQLYEKAPTADLEDNRPALPDEVALGVKYKDIDDYLEGKDVSDQAAETIEKWYQKPPTSGIYQSRFSIIFGSNA